MMDTGLGRMGGTSWTRGLWDMEAWRWTTNAARPSKWAALSDGPFGQRRFVKRMRECTDMTDMENESVEVRMMFGMTLSEKVKIREILDSKFALDPPCYIL